MICCVTNRARFLIFQVARNRFKLLLVHQSGKAGFPNSFKVIYCPEISEERHFSEVRDLNKLQDMKSDKDSRHTIAVFCQFTHGNSTKEDFTLRTTEMQDFRKESKNPCFFINLNDSNPKNCPPGEPGAFFRDLCMANNQSDIMLYRMDTSNLQDTSRVQVMAQGVSTAFGQIKVVSLRKIDLNGIEAHRSLSVVSKELWIKFYSRFLILNCKDGCKVVILDTEVFKKTETEPTALVPKSLVIDLIPMDGVNIHEIRILPVLPQIIVDEREIGRAHV